MARATTSTFGNFKVLVGDGGSPTEIFSNICGLTSKAINYESDTTEVEVPDCSNEDLPSYKEAGIKAYKVSLEASGMWAAESHGMLHSWWQSGVSKNIQVQYVNALTGQLKTLQGPALLSTRKNNVDKGGRLTETLSIEFTSNPTYINAP